MAKYNRTAFASEARTATPTAVQVTDDQVMGIQVVIDVTAIAATPSVTPAIDGYDPASEDVPQNLQQIENYNPRQDNTLLSYLGTEDATSRLMPPVLREQLEETPENNERKRLGIYLYKLRQERINEIKGILQQEEQ